MTGSAEIKAKRPARAVPHSVPRQFFRTSPMPCPYLTGKIERHLLTHLGGSSANLLHDRLAEAGFRRSHNLLYRPACPGCNSCVPVRVVADEFRLGRTLRRVTAANAELQVAMQPAQSTTEQFNLFRRYQRARHYESEMARMDFDDFRAMVEESPVDTCMAEFRTPQGGLVAACLVDRLSSGLSAVYSFFDPAEEQRGLGNYVILWLIAEARRQQRPYVYLGYWIDDCAKMSYKVRYRPLEQFTANGWTRIA
jgi:arginyl-tRNA--protein-N-Asp/Glu arginylyltransferase